jgi:hypothetical protein
MFFEPILSKYRDYLKWSYRALGFLQIAEKFAFLFLILILFNGYEFAYFLPGMNTFLETQTYVEPYWFNIILMAAGAMILTFLSLSVADCPAKKRNLIL